VDEGLLLLLVGAILGASIVVHSAQRAPACPSWSRSWARNALGSDGPGGIAFDDAKLARESESSGSP
jgi:hypothetical protein